MGAIRTDFQEMIRLRAQFTFTRSPFLSTPRLFILFHVFIPEEIHASSFFLVPGPEMNIRGKNLIKGNIQSTLEGSTDLHQTICK